MFSKNYSLFHIMYLQTSFLPRLYSHSRSLENTHKQIHSHSYTHTHMQTHRPHTYVHTHIHIYPKLTHKEIDKQYPKPKCTFSY